MQGLVVAAGWLPQIVFILAGGIWADRLPRNLVMVGSNAVSGAAQVVVVFAFALACFAALVPYELRRREPLLEMRFFRSIPFAGASAIAVCVFAAIGGFLFMNTLYLQDVRGLSPLHAGLYVLPMAMMSVIFGPLSGVMVGRFGTRPSLVIGGIFITASGVLLTRLGNDTSAAMLIGSYVVFGIGFGFVNPPITSKAYIV